MSLRPKKPSLPHKPWSLNHDLRPIYNGICHYVAMNCWEFISEKCYKLIMDHIELSNIDDRVLLTDRQIRSTINWNRLSKKHLIRLMCRDKTVLDLIDISSYDFNISELESFFKFHPDMFERFTFYVEDLTNRDLITLLKINPELIEQYESGTISFNVMEYTEIIREFNQVHAIIKLLEFEKMDNFHTRSLLIYTGDKYIDKLILKKLKILDWIEIVKERPELVNYIPDEILKNANDYNICQFACYVPDLEFLIEERKDQLSAFCWEYLLTHNAEGFKNICDFSKLKEVNWINILKARPELYYLKPGQPHPSSPYQS